MGLGAKLNFAFLTVILVMVAAHAAAQYIGEKNHALSMAHRVVDPAIREVTVETKTIQKRNEALAIKLSTDGSFNQAYQAKDRAAVAAAIKSFVDRNGLSGYVTVIDGQGKVFFSSDSPSKFGYPVRDMSREITDLLHQSSVWLGPAALTVPGTFSIVGMVPVRSGNTTTGLVAVCQPINTEFFTGLQKKVEITQNVQNLDLLLYSFKEGRVVAITPGLQNGQDAGVVNALNREGMKAIGGNETEKAGRFWSAYRFVSSDNQLMAVVLVTTPMPDMKLQLAAIAGQAAISGFLAIVLSFFFSMAISGKYNRSLQFLVQRARDLAAQKRDIPALDGLSGEWIELAEVIDTAVTSPRASVRSLQTQMSRHQDELEEKQKMVEQANSQVEAVNRQLMIQSKQLSEISKQINHANTQSILLQQKLASVLQISTEGYLILDAFGNVVSANPILLNWTGCNENELAGRFCFDLVRRPGEDASNGQHPPFSQHIAKPADLIAQFYPEGMIYHSREPKKVDVLIHLQPIMTDDQNVQGFVMVLRDKSLHSEAHRLRNEIVAMLQDSIRAPLAVADQKWSSVLSTTSSQYGNTPLAPALIDLHSNYQSLLGVIDSLLMMHTGVLPTPIVHREQVSITRLIGDCLEQVAQQARAHQIMLDYKTVTGLPNTTVDKQILRDIVAQLLEKMISVTAPGGRVRVESTAKNNEIRLSIFSSGPALPQMEIEDMFAGFIQGKHAEDTYGSRLNMYLVRNNLERLGGKIWAESDRGTYFYFTLPVQ